MDDRQSRSHAMRVATSWKTYVFMVSLVILAGAMLVGFDSDRFRPASGTASALALSSSR